MEEKKTSLHSLHHCLAGETTEYFIQDRRAMLRKRSWPPVI